MTGAVGKRHYFEDLSVGLEASSLRVVSEEDIASFAAVSGDHNPVHLDEAYAATTPFKQRIAHGILSASYISAILGTKLPGPGAIYISQTLNFKAPVFIGDEVVTTVRVTDLIEARKRALLSCVCRVGEKTVLEGEAVLLVPSRAAS